MKITIPMRTKSEANQREHWRAKAARVAKQRALVELAFRAAYTRQPFPLLITMMRVAPCALDDDNLAGSMKATRDSVASVLGIDDRDPRVSWRVAQRRGAVREYAVEIEVAPRPATCPTCGQALLA